MITIIAAAALVGLGAGFRIGLFGLLFCCLALAIGLPLAGFAVGKTIVAVVAFQLAAAVAMAARHGLFGRDLPAAAARTKPAAGKSIRAA